MAAPPDPYEVVAAELPRAAAAVLDRTGPLPFDDLLWMLRWADVFVPLEEDGDYDESDQHRMLEDLVEFGFDGFHRTADDRIAHVAALVDGITLSHVLTPSERRRSVLDLGVDLAVITAYRYRYQWVGGGEVKVARSYPTPELMASARALGFAIDDEADPHGSLTGPPGWLEPFAVGDVLTIGLAGRSLAVGRTHLRCLPPLARSPLVAALDLAARRRIEEAYDEYLVLDGYPEHLMLDALVHHADLLRFPELPVSTAFAHLGLEWDGEVLIRRPVAAARQRPSPTGTRVVPTRPSGPS